MELYNDVLFHRVIRQFMVQTGDPDSKNAAPDAMLGAGGPGYNIEAEIDYPRYFHKKGALAAARQGDEVNPNRESSGSQFYIVTGRRYTKDQLNQMQVQISNMRMQQILDTLVVPYRKEIMKLRMAKDTVALNKLSEELLAKAQAEYAKSPFSFTEEQVKAYTTVGGTPHLDGQYTVFGEVVAGMETIEAIEVPSHPFAVGVQWHPECMYRTSPEMRSLFHEFVLHSLINPSSTGHNKL